MKNIGIYIYDYSLLGGAQKVTYNLANLMFNSGFPIRTVLSYCVEGKINYSYPKEIEVVNLNYNLENLLKQINKCNVGNLIVQVENLKLCYEIIQLVRKKSNCNIIPVLHNSPYYWLRKYYSLSEYFSRPIHILQYLKMRFYWHNLNMKIFSELTKNTFVCVSERAKKEMEQILGNNSLPNVQYIYNPIDINFGNVDFSSKKPILIYLGRLSTEKRTRTMLRIWKRVWKILPSWTFLIVGDGPDLDQMKKYVAIHNIQGVIFTGFCSDVYKYLTQSMASILISKYEGLPTGMLESCASQNVLVGCKNDGGLSDILYDGMNGILLDLDDLDRSADELISLLSNYERMKSLSANNSKLFGKFTNQSILDSWKLILK